MKRLVSFLLAVVVMVTSCASVAYAEGKGNAKRSKWNYEQGLKQLKEKLKQYYKGAEMRSKLLKDIADLKKKNKDRTVIVLVDGKEVELGSSPVIKDKYSRMLIPIVPIVKALGAKVALSDENKTITITRGDTTIVLKAGSNTAIVNGKEVKLEDYMKMNGNRMVVPVSFIAKVLKCRMNIDEDSGTVIIDKENIVAVNDSVTGSGLNMFEFSDGWSSGQQQGAYLNDNHWSGEAGEYYQVRFKGTQIKLYGAKAPNHGIAAVSIDGSPAVSVDFYSSERKDNVLLYTSSRLSDGEHILKVQVTGLRNLKASNHFITADRVQITEIAATPAPINGNQYEAENAALSGGVVKSTSHSGFSGTAFVEGYTHSGAETSFTVNAPARGVYNVSLRYSNDTGSDKTLSIYVNGTRIRQITFADLANWDSWSDKAELLILNQGSNVITYRYDSGDSGNVNLDYIKLAPSAGQLSGNLTPASQKVNLSTDGTIDWIHWGYEGADSVNRKSGAAQQISNFTRIGSGTVAWLSGGANPISYSWSGGAPSASVTDTNTSVFLAGAGNGFQFTVPADTALRTLKVYAGAWDAKGKLQATLSDGSALPYEEYIDSNGAAVSKAFVLSYKAASAGQTLTVKYTVDSVHSDNFVHITLQAATLK
jgi:hypothetical protein